MIVNTQNNHVLMKDFKPTKTQNSTVQQGRHPAGLIKQCNANAVSAERYYGDFGADAQCQMIIGNDISSSLAFEMTVLAFGHAVVAYFVAPTGLGFGTSVEIVFDDDVAGNAIQFYNRLPDKIGRKHIEKAAAKYPAIACLLDYSF